MMRLLGHILPISLLMLSTPVEVGLSKPVRGVKARSGNAAIKRSAATSQRERRRKKRTYDHKHRVVRGDTLWKIAKRYRVKVSQLREWNTLKKDKLSLGQTLVIKLRPPTPRASQTTYVVQPGDSLWRIARKLRCRVHELKRLNGLKTSRLRVGQRLVYFRRGPEKPSESVGSPSNGRLVNGEPMPPGSGYHVLSRRKSHGTNETVDILIRTIARLHRRIPAAGQILIGDISLKRGGSFPPHASHQSGRDVDLSYYVKGEKRPRRFRPARPKNLDVKRTWAFLKLLIETRRVEKIFIDYALQKPLYQYALKRERKRWLRRVFQFPKGRTAGGLIKHLSGHINHMHVRFKCPRGDKHCR